MCLVIFIFFFKGYQYSGGYGKLDYTCGFGFNVLVTMITLTSLELTFLIGIIIGIPGNVVLLFISIVGFKLLYINMFIFIRFISTIEKC